MILEVMKPQIAAGSRGVPAAYGEILFRVWKDSAAGDKNNGAVSSEVSQYLSSLIQFFYPLQINSP